MDETSCQNVPNVTRVLYTPGEKNIQRKHPVKIGINVTGFQGINCNSYMEVNTKNNAFQFIITLCHYRIENMENTSGKQLIKEAIKNENLSDDEIKNYLSSKSLNKMDLINKINNELYNDNSQQTSIEKIQKICNKEDNNNSRKIWHEKRSRLLNNLLNPKITEINSKEKKINIILDNARIHHAKIVEKACEILNINLIFLQPYCPDLNPIEDVWRKIKSTIYKSIYKNLNELIEIFKREYYKIVDLTSFYKNWVKEYLGINI
ncbi:hypothetical protein MBORA_00070 [Methanobrevibacter oralis]|uniref:Tc1-like transposase DDE domain-containing protein n=6 Tax=Methanobrevibacter TaxID=2172 RepID=A0A166CE22_METOA|nr:transposase [Methanobrevibacter oralis]KZX14409.1 hypothetical protein MBORA_00070 [Methanobrevibacter oralis]